MLHYLLYGLPRDIAMLHSTVINENPELILLSYCLVVLWLILLFSRH
ncbi:hypothetical protein [Yokenella regensburgei]|uniref:Uncharacterized protein n=1 Tax=Yokenella regensburgei TaxID=158877 RepID=A0AB38FWI5_9ENTR|nr:hypothetical protein [Yokenella regensburgei]KFD24784.1 hypothetical protein GYRE_00753 [Yokenella regensburgei ATCC 49455]SQA63000.1 Uncharacterised protein [Yokenella regensburgei]SQB02244.1 Uncharacterised protein [Yokenella regensburgei]SUQ07456.1 Uncharacterised protein [Yokenella regensburgei]